MMPAVIPFDVFSNNSKRLQLIVRDMVRIRMRKSGNTTNPDHVTIAGNLWFKKENTTTTT